jgi:biotin carboxyl carrier protein
MGTRWVTWIDGRQATVELLGIEASPLGERVRARIEEGEVRREVTLERSAARANGQRWVVVDGGPRASAHVGAPDGEGSRQVAVGRLRVPVRAVAELDAWLGSGDDAAGAGAVTVAMPGRVVKVLAEVGASVDKGQPVLIIEAMKMENEVKARRAGKVLAVHVTEGDSVEGGRTLMEIGD